MNHLEKIVLTEETSHKINVNSIRIHKAAIICAKCRKPIDLCDDTKSIVICDSCKTASKKDSCRIVNDMILSIEFGKNLSIEH